MPSWPIGAPRSSRDPSGLAGETASGALQWGGGVMNLYRRAVATYDTSDPDTTGWFEEIRTALHQTPPFEGSGDTHPWDGHEAPNGPELWRQCPCPHRMLLVDAVTTALAHHAIYL